MFPVVKELLLLLAFCSLILAAISFWMYVLRRKYACAYLKAGTV